MRYEALVGPVGYVLEFSGNEPFIEATFSMNHLGHEIVRETRAYTKPVLEAIITDFWHDPPRKNRLPVYLPSYEKLRFERITS